MRAAAAGWACLALLVPLVLARRLEAQPEGPPAAQPPAAQPPAAQPPTDAPPPAAAPKVPAPDLARARKLHATGQRFFDQGDYVSALDAFEQAYAAAPRPNLLFTRAQTHKKLFAGSGHRAHKDRAIALYRAFLAVAPKGELYVSATTALESLGPPAEVAPGDAPAAPPDEPRARPKTTLAIDSPAEGALISVNGGPAAPPQVSVEVTPGRHTVTVTAPGYVTRELSVQAIPEQITPETVELEEMNGIVTLASSSDDLTVHVDGRPAGAVRSLSLEPGRHFISVTGRGLRSQGRAVTIERGASTTESFEPDATPQRYASIALMAAGGAGLIAGGVTLGLAADRDARAAELDRTRLAGFISEHELAEYDLLHAERDAFRGAGIATTIAGASVAVLGLTLFLVDHPAPLAAPADSAPGGRSPAPRPAPVELVLAPAAGPGFGGLWARGHF